MTALLIKGANLFSGVEAEIVGNVDSVRLNARFSP
jgi:hypothetical protein